MCIFFQVRYWCRQPVLEKNSLLTNKILSFAELRGKAATSKVMWHSLDHVYNIIYFRKAKQCFLMASVLLTAQPVRWLFGWAQLAEKVLEELRVTVMGWEGKDKARQVSLELEKWGLRKDWAALSNLESMNWHTAIHLVIKPWVLCMNNRALIKRL